MNSGTNIPFGARRIGSNFPVCVIAEIGINHEGSVEVCARMTEAAARAGADAIKLQTIDADANYMTGTESYDLFRRASLTREETAQIFTLARSLNLEPFTTAGDAATLAWVDRLDPAAHKISSGLVTHLPIIREAARTGRSVLISTGMATPEDIAEAIAAARDAGGGNIGLFQCTSLYPTPPQQASLASIAWLAERFGVPTGYSDHTLGMDVTALAVAAGAKFIEKHFTLDTKRFGFDHPISLDERNFAEMVRRIRAAEAALGTPGKEPTPEEKRKAPLLRRIVVALEAIPAGTTLTTKNLGCKRPLPGILGAPPRDYERLLGRRAVRDLRPDEPVTFSCVEDNT